MSKMFLKLMMAGCLVVPSLVSAQPTVSPQRVDGLWVFRALFPGQTQAVYTGSANFRPDGTFAGPENDQHSSGSMGIWIATGNYGEFAFTFLSNSFDAMGNYQSTSRIRGIMTISADGLSASGKVKVDVFDPIGQVIFSSGNTFTGTRFVVAPF
jgi:hypothetical protein